MRLFLPIFLVLASSCGSAGGASTFVGSVEGTDIKVGLVTDGGKAALFFCGGPSSFTQSTRWFRGDGAPSAISFTSANWAASGSANGELASGMVNPGIGSSLRWTAKRVSEDGLPGLYESTTDPDGTAGVVVLDESTMQGAMLPKGSTATSVQQIVPILPITRSPDGIRVTVNGATAREIKVVRTRAR